MLQSGAGDTHKPVFPAVLCHLCLDLVQASQQMPSCPPLPNPLSTPLPPVLAFGRHKPDHPAPQLDSSGISTASGESQMPHLAFRTLSLSKASPFLPRQGPSILATSYSGPIFLSFLMPSLRQLPLTLSLYPHTSTPP